MDQDVPWRDFKQKHGKHYGSVQEEQERYRIYKDNLAKIEQLNDENEKINGNRPFGVNEFTDLDPAEFAKGYLTYNQAKDTREIEPPSQKTFVSSASLPSQVDWSQKGACTPVKNQGNCGSCWAFSAIEELESATFMSTGNLPLLSAQQVTSCSTADNGCGGGDTVSAYSYMIRAGVQSDASYPYTSGSTGSTGSCRYDSTSVTARMTGWQYGIPGCSSRDPSCASQAASEPQLMQVVSAQGPASVCLNATPWQYYTGGVMASNCASDYYSMNHCVQLVGYGTSTDGSQYWILRNQWGTSWGNGGFISLKMGSNLCGLANEVTYVTGVSSSGPSPAPTPTPTPTPTYSPTPTPTPTPIQQAVLQVYTSQSVYSRGSTVKITTRVLSSTGTGVFGAKVIVTLRKPNGVTLQGSATTGSTGTIVFGYFLQQSDPLGTYSIQASSSVNGASLSSSTSFKVQ